MILDKQVKLASVSTKYDPLCYFQSEDHPEAMKEKRRTTSIAGIQISHQWYDLLRTGILCTHALMFS